MAESRPRQPTTICWFRRDLRLDDHPALSAANEAGRVLPVFVVDDALWGPAGDVRRAFLAGCLESLASATRGHLVIRAGDPVAEVPRLAREVEATAVYVSADFGPYGRERDERMARALGGLPDPVRLERVGSPYAVEPGTVVKEDGSPLRVFTPFSRRWRDHGWPVPTPRPPRMSWLSGVKGSGPPPAPEVRADLPTPGEAGARRRWEAFAAHGLDRYGDTRDQPGGDHTSRLSPYLKWGCIHPRTLLDGLGRGKGPDRFRSELCWREFYADVLWHHPASARHALQEPMARMRLDRGAGADERFAAWAEGRTGYPIVDAGMRQLAAEAWVHNRVRMIVASFLVKDLHIDWLRGARYFMEHLVDGDLASNNHGWQWVAGTGTDAAPYFRVFNPVTQGRKFDPDGDYVRRWVPELASLPARYVHCPWDADQLPIDAQGYPDRIVDHHAEREEALARYQATRS